MRTSHLFALALLIASGCREGSGRSPYAGLPQIKGVVIDSGDETAGIVPVQVNTTFVTQNTNVDGRFSLPTTDGVQLIRVSAGRTTGAAIVRFDSAAHPGFELPRPIYVPKVNRNRAVEIDPNRSSDLLLRSDDVPGLEISLPASTQVTFPAGSPNELLIVPMPIDRLYEPLPDGRVSRQLFQIEPLGVELSPRVNVRLSNIDGLRPAADVDVFRLSPTTGLWTLVDSARVDASGTRLDGALIPGGGLYALAPRPLPPATTLIGRVRSPSGAPVSRAMITCGFGLSDLTDAAGEFRIENVPATFGAITVRAITQSNHPLEQLLVGPLDLVPDTILDLGTLTLDARQPDIIRPTFSISPGDGAEDVSINTLVTLSFSPVPIDERSVDSGSIVLQYQGLEGGTRFSLGETILAPDNRTLVFAHREQLKPLSEYTVILSPFITGTDGNTIDPKALESIFYTGEDEAVPTSPALFGPARRTVRTGETLELYGVGFDGSASVSLDGDPMTVLSEDPWTITVEIPDRAAGAGLDIRATSTGGNIPERTSVAVSIEPTLSSLSPNRFTVAGGETITLTGTGLGTAQLDFNGVLVENVSAIDTNTIEATVPERTLSGPLGVRIGGMRAEVPLYFLTPAELDDVPPAVSMVDPPSDAVDVPLFPTILLTFTERISRDAFFVVTDGVDEVPGTIRIDQSGEQAIATFTPFFELAPSTEYLITVSGGVVDLGDNPLDQDGSAPGAQAFLSRFTTVE